MYEAEILDSNWPGWTSIPAVAHPEVDDTIMPKTHRLFMRSAIAVVERDFYGHVDIDDTWVWDEVEEEPDPCRKRNELPLPDPAALTLSASETKRLNAARVKTSEQLWLASLCQLNV